MNWTISYDKSRLKDVDVEGVKATDVQGFRESSQERNNEIKYNKIKYQPKKPVSSLCYMLKVIKQYKKLASL